MPATAKSPLGASTTNRKWYLDVNTGTEAAPVWTGVFGITDFTPALEATLQDDSDYDSEGYKSQTKTASQWSLTGTVKRSVTSTSPTAYDPGQEALRLAADENGVANSVHVRWYEMEEGGPRVEAYEGNGGVQWSPNGGGMDALSTAGFTVTGQGKRTPITHPDNVAEVAPTITSLSPSSTPAAGGDLVIITGSGFATATAVEVDNVAVPATDWDVVSGDKIALVAPAHAVGSGAVTVVNGAGESAPSVLTYV